MVCGIKDIAREAGVSHTTVSRVLRDTEGFSYAAKTREKILAVAREMGYAPHPVAQLMRLKKTKLIGIATKTAASYFSYILAQRVSDEIKSLGYAPAFLDLSATVISSDLAANLRPDLLRGIISQYPSLTEAALKVLRKNAISAPIVTLGDWPDEKNGVYRVTSDHAGGTRKVMAHLRELGHRAIAYIGYRENGGEKHVKNAVFMAEAASFGLRPFEFLTSSGDSENSFVAAARLAEAIAATPAITAAICEDDEFAQGLISGLLQRGVKVPADFSVAGYDDLPFAAHVNPALTTVRQDIPRIARDAARLLISRVEVTPAREDFLPSKILVETELVIRGSTQPPKRDTP